MASLRKTFNRWISRLRKRTLPVGLAILFLGMGGVFIDIIGGAGAELSNAALVVYADGMGFAPSLIAADTGPDMNGNGIEPASLPESANTMQPQREQATGLLGGVPDRVVIPSIGLYAPITTVDKIPVQLDGETYHQWIAPRGFRAGWHADSALLGIGGNTVINGHHNAYGEVFQNLIDVQENDVIILSSGDDLFFYTVAVIAILEERFASIEQRLANASWIGPTDDERLTLITCWPETSNTHRLIIVADPLPMPEINHAG
jgi:LPXTG-site transpeptidase (sortase) family protein